MKTRSLKEIAKDIRADWKNIPYYAEAYLKPMETLNSIEDNYFLDSAKSVVLYFLANAKTWRGPKAREIKQELKLMVK